MDPQLKFIQDQLGVNQDIALRVHDRMQKYYNVEFKNVGRQDLQAYVMLAYQDLNKFI